MEHGSEERRLRHRVSTLAAAVLLGVGFYPWKTEIVPELSVVVVDEEGLPLPGVPTTEHWTHWSWGKRGYIESVTSEDGRVRFDPVRARASILRRGLFPSYNIATRWFRAHFHISAHIVIGDRKHWGGVYYEPGDPLPTQIVAKRIRVYLEGDSEFDP
jgi:hypothetical protein